MAASRGSRASRQGLARVRHRPTRGTSDFPRSRPQPRSDAGDGQCSLIPPYPRLADRELAFALVTRLASGPEPIRLYRRKKGTGRGGGGGWVSRAGGGG